MSLRLCVNSRALSHSTHPFGKLSLLNAASRQLALIADDWSRKGRETGRYEENENKVDCARHCFRCSSGGLRNCRSRTSRCEFDLMVIGGCSGITSLAAIYYMCALAPRAAQSKGQPHPTIAMRCTSKPGGAPAHCTAPHVVIR